MTESEKRRALLADLQSFIGGSCRQGCTHWGCSLRRRVDAALSAEDDGPTTLSEWADHGMRLTRERDQARAEVERLQRTINRISVWTHTYGADLVPPPGWADSFGDGMRQAKGAVAGIILPVPEDK